MKTNGIFRHLTIAGICSIVFVWGCAQQGRQPTAVPAQPKEKIGKAGKAAAEQAVAPAKPAEPGSIKIALKPAPGEQVSYKVTAQARRGIKWEGPVPEKAAFNENFNDEQWEMVITQRIQSVDSDGRAVSQVTVDRLKYLAIIKNKTEADFDSTKQSDANSPLARLIGQSYSIVVEPDNYISSVSSAAPMEAGMSGQMATDRAVQSILSPESIIERQTALLLPQAGNEQLKPGDKWSRIKTFSFGLMGLKSYEKIYTLKEVRRDAGHEIAVINMNAIPTAEVEKGFGEQTAADSSKMFDTSDTYTGDGEVDLTDGCINSYQENLQASWTAAMPPSSSAKGDVNEPVVLNMTAVRTYKIERIK